MARRKVTQAQLAEQLGCTQPAISRRLSGVISWDVDELTRVAEFLGVPLSSLLAEPAPAAVAQ